MKDLCQKLSFIYVLLGFHTHQITSEYHFLYLEMTLLHWHELNYFFLYRFYHKVILHLKGRNLSVVHTLYD